MRLVDRLLKRQNECYTYFRIVGDFSPAEVTKRLGLPPEKAWNIGDRCENGTRHAFASWMIGCCGEYDVNTENQMRKTIAPLLDKVEQLNGIRAENDVSFYLEVVPTIRSRNNRPCLAPSLDVIDFCHATRTEIDIDMYL